MKGRIDIFRSKRDVHNKKIKQAYVVYAENKVYLFYAASFADRKDWDRLGPNSRLEVEFEVDEKLANKVRKGSLVVTGEFVPAVAMSERRASSNALSNIQAIELSAVCGCILSNVASDERGKGIRFQGARREVFDSAEDLCKYMETGFNENKELHECIHCRSEPHSSGEALTFRQYYRLDELPERRELLERILQAKKTDCTCTGWVFPHPPNNVFRRATPEQRDAIDRKFNQAKKRTDSSGQLHRDKFLELSGVKPVPKAQLNHLIPKQAGGCPVGVFNLQAHDALCDVCRTADNIVTGWQAQDWSHFNGLQNTDSLNRQNEERTDARAAEVEEGHSGSKGKEKFP